MTLQGVRTQVEQQELIHWKGWAGSAVTPSSTAHAPCSKASAPRKLLQRPRLHPGTPHRILRGRLWLGSWSSPARAGPVRGQFKLTCSAGTHRPRCDRRGGRARWAGTENVRLQEQGTRRPVAAVAAGMRRSEWSRWAPL